MKTKQYKGKFIEKKKKIKKLAKIMMMMMIMKFQNDFLKLISPVRFRFEKKKKKGEKKQNKTKQIKKLILKYQKIKQPNCNNVDRGESSRWRWKHGRGFLHHHN